MSWFLREINEVGTTVRLCMEDGRLITGRSLGVDISADDPTGVLSFQSGNSVYRFVDTDIADYITL